MVTWENPLPIANYTSGRLGHCRYHQAFAPFLEFPGMFVTVWQHAPFPHKKRPHAHFSGTPDLLPLPKSLFLCNGADTR